jgi:hypothetical protein
VIFFGGEKYRDAYVKLLESQVEWFKKQREQDRERIDRLTETLAHKSGFDLVLPVAPPPPVQGPVFHNPWKDPNQLSKPIEQEKRQ